ncbi:DUF4118 domain-containing protein, partial [Pyxidicoccus sp. 3LFB2]
MTPSLAHASARTAPWPVQVLIVGLLLCGCVAVSLGLDTFTHSAPFPIFLAGILTAAWSGGRWPALCLTVLGTLALTLLFLSPRWTLAIASPGDSVLLATFCLVGGFISVSVGLLREARLRAEQLRRLTEALARTSTPTELAAVVRAQAFALLGASSSGLWTMPSDQGPEAARHVPASSTEAPPRCRPCRRTSPWTRRRTTPR